MKMFTYRKKICKFCENKNMEIDYKNPAMLRRFITEQGKILPPAPSHHRNLFKASTVPGNGHQACTQHCAITVHQ